MPLGGGGKVESRTKQLARLMANEALSSETYWRPYAETLLKALTTNPKRVLKISLDGSTLGRGCMGLMASAVYAGRSLPIG